MLNGENATKGYILEKSNTRHSTLLKDHNIQSYHIRIL